MVSILLFFLQRSRNCLDTNGKMTLFALKKGSDQTFLWKATVRIACIKCDPETKKVESYKWIDLRQFLKIFNTFQAHLEAMSSSEEQNDKVLMINKFNLKKKNIFNLIFFFFAETCIKSIDKCDAVKSNRWCCTKQ